MTTRTTITNSYTLVANDASYVAIQFNEDSEAITSATEPASTDNGMMFRPLDIATPAIIGGGDVYVRLRQTTAGSVTVSTE